jgi:ferredoxin
MNVSPTPEMFDGTVEVTLLNRNGEKIDVFSMRKGTNLWVFLRKRGWPIGAACSGVGVCGACDVWIEGADEHCVPSPTEFEINTLERQGKDPSERLACLCRVFSDLTVRAQYW